MVGREGLEEADKYGVSAWVAGIILSGALVLIMFGLAQGFA
jgi:hypothetical protein